METFSVWAIQDIGLNSIQNSMNNMQLSYLEKTSIEQDKIDLFTIKDGVLFYPIEGIMIPDASPLMLHFGFVDTLKIIADLENIFSQEDVHTMILIINSPGGSLTGIPELASTINNISNNNIRTVAFSNTVLGSAAYYIASATNNIIVTPSTMIGSIGVIQELAVNNFYERKILFTEGDYKATGHPSKTLDLKDMQYFKDLTNFCYESMIADIAKYRKVSVQSVRDTQAVTVIASMNSWFYNKLVNSLGELLLHLFSNEGGHDAF